MFASVTVRPPEGRAFVLHSGEHPSGAAVSAGDVLVLEVDGSRSVVLPPWLLADR